MIPKPNTTFASMVWHMNCTEDMKRGAAKGKAHGNHQITMLACHDLILFWASAMCNATWFVHVSIYYGVRI